jgi:hypothetical protein
MYNILNLASKKILILIVILIVVIIALVAISFNKGQRVFNPNQIVTQTPIPTITVTPLQKVIIGKTTTEEFDRSDYKPENKISLPQNSQKYILNSPLNTRPSEIVFEDNIATFERIIIIGNPTASGFDKISQFLRQYGPAEKIIKGSKFYGRDMLTYIYANKGFVFIANGFSDQVLELQTFQPTTIDQYIKTYGEDIMENNTPTVDF